MGGVGSGLNEVLEEVAGGVEDEGAGSVPVPFGPEIPNVVVSLVSINASSDAHKTDFLSLSQVAMRQTDLISPNPNPERA